MWKQHRWLGLCLGFMLIQLGCTTVVYRDKAGKKNVHVCFLAPSMGLCSGWVAGQRIDHRLLPKDSEIRKVLGKLRLKEDQKSALRQLYKASRQSTKKEQSKLRSIRNQLAKLFATDKPNVEAIQKLVRQGYVVTQQMALVRTSYLLKMHAIFTPTQRKKLLAEIRRLAKKYRAKYPAERTELMPSFLR